jgi:copper ion binding protein
MTTEPTTFHVTGMTCGHCVASVSTAVGSVANVEQVDVDLDAGTVAVTGDDVDPAAVRAAVVDAGYEVAS